MSSLSYQEIDSAFAKTPLFDGKDWIYAPEPFKLTTTQSEELHAIGIACLQFYEALNALYTKLKEAKPILRNGQLDADWALHYLEQGKPEYLLNHAISKKVRTLLPPVIRPDLLLTDKGWILTELDSVPGGIGLTAFLYALYEKNTNLLGSKKAFIEYFWKALMTNSGKQELLIVVSEEASTYRPEMEWLAKELGDKYPTKVISPEELDSLDLKDQLVYRFWELFDLPNLPSIRNIFQRIEEGELTVKPAMKHHLEEKMSLALFHHPRLKKYWQQSIGKRSRKLLSQIIPLTWAVDASTIPVNANLWGPEVDGSPLANWNELSEAGKADRNLILKRSGFAEDCWGARSVTLGNDVSQEQWSLKLKEAINDWGRSPYVLQNFHKPSLSNHSVFTSKNEIELRKGRTRICPYFFIFDNTANFAGALATFCPSDKKIIHGMSDAALLPCAIEPNCANQ